jgi:hypothetical protein
MLYLLTTTAKGPVTIGPFSNEAQVQTFLEGAEQRGFARDQFSQAMVRSATEFLGRFPEEDEQTRKERQEAKSAEA